MKREERERTLTDSLHEHFLGEMQSSKAYRAEVRKWVAVNLIAAVALKCFEDECALRQSFYLCVLFRSYESKAVRR